MSIELYEKTLEFAEATGEALDSATKLAHQLEQQKQAADQRAPALAKALKEAGFIGPDDEKRAEELLHDPVQTLSILGNVLGRMQTEKAAAAQARSPDRLGQAVAPAAKKVASTESPFVGRRAGEGEVRESDLAMLRLIGK